MRDITTFAFLLLLAGCVVVERTERVETQTVQNITNETIVRYGAGEPMALRISSPAFENNTVIPALYTCQGQDINPALQFEGVPAETKSLVFIMDDPDAPMGTWVHWVVFNIPPTTTQVLANSVPEGIVGRNSWPKNAYGGPCPPSGTHRYFFKLYALDVTLPLTQAANKKDVEAAMQGHIIAQAQLIGLYKKS